MGKSNIIWNGNSKKIQFSPSKSLCHKKLGPKQQKDLTMNFFCFWCVSAKILQWAFSISIYNFCWIYIKHFYNHYKFFSQITKTNYLLGNNTCKHYHSNILTSQVILKKLQELGTVLSNGSKYHQTLILSAKHTALVRVIRLSRGYLFVPKMVPLVIY